MSCPYAQKSIGYLPTLINIMISTKIKLEPICLAFQMLKLCTFPAPAKPRGTAVGGWEDQTVQLLPGAGGVTSSRSQAWWPMLVLLAEDQVMQVKSFPAPTCGELQCYQFLLGERRRQVTEVYCSTFAASARGGLPPLAPWLSSVLTVLLGWRCCFCSCCGCFSSPHFGMSCLTSF